MRPRIVFLVLAFVSSAQLQATVCLATYGPESTSAPASGLNFRILVIAGPNVVVRRQEASPDLGYLESGGQIQTTCQNSSIFHLASGLLSSGGKQTSVASDVPSSRFSTSDSMQALDSMFAVATDGTLVWNNEDFDERNARFGADSKGIVYGIYSGSMPSNYARVTLKVMNPSECPDVPDNATSSTFQALLPNSSMTVGPITQPQPVPSNTTSLTSLKGPRMPIWPTSSSPSNISSSFSPSVTNPTSSSASTSSMASGSSPGSRNLTTSADLTPSANLTASIPSYMSPRLPSDARSTIVSNCWYDWCNDLLGYTANQAGAKILFSTMTATTIAVTRPSATTGLDQSTLLSTKDVPSEAVIITVTPTLTTIISDLYIDTATIITEILTTTATPTYWNPSALPSAIQKLRVRQAPNGTLSTPAALQSYSPDFLSLACSDLFNHSIPTSCIPAPIVGTTLPATILHISYTTTGPIILNSTIISPQNVTLTTNSTTLISTTPPVVLNSTIIIPQNITLATNSTTFIFTVTTTTLPPPSHSPITTAAIQSPIILNSTIITQQNTILTTNSTTLISTVTTITPSLTSSSTTTTTSFTTPLPSPPIYPACLNLTTSLHGNGISVIDNKPNNVTSTSTPTAYDCCVQCQITPLCGGMYWIGNTCAMVMAAYGVCRPGVPVGSFEALSYTEVGEGYTLSNGTCGVLVQ